MQLMPISCRSWSRSRCLVIVAIPHQSSAVVRYDIIYTGPLVSLTFTSELYCMDSLPMSVKSMEVFSFGNHSILQSEMASCTVQDVLSRWALRVCFLPDCDIENPINPLARSNNLTLFPLGMTWLASLLPSDFEEVVKLFTSSVTCRYVGCLHGIVECNGPRSRWSICKDPTIRR